ncbi:MAG TPA: alpha-N-arabinofuranosidase, partial [Mesotoga infera]|nr:alpha-N-arabinofuranosidase [Mesotoga infera]
MKPRILISIVVFMAVLFFPASILADIDHVMTVNPSSFSPISPILYGIFFEDINHAVDGGLYAELVRNRSFEHTDRMEGWSVILDKGCKASFSIKSERPVNGNNTHYLSFDIESDDGCVILANNGYDGIPLVWGENYTFSSLIRGDEYNGEIEVHLIDE